MKKNLLFFLLFYFNLIIGIAQPGALDLSFNPNDIGIGNGDGAIQNDEKIIIGGWFGKYNGDSLNCVARLNPDGSIDSSFNIGTGANARVRKVSVQSDGKILVGGDFDTFNNIPRNYIVRLNTDGTLDNSFNPGSGANSSITTTSVQNDGKIIIGGAFTYFNGTSIKYIARLNANGSLDTTFNPGTGANNNIYSSSIQSDGKIIIGGSFTDKSVHFSQPFKRTGQYNPGKKKLVFPDTKKFIFKIHADNFFLPFGHVFISSNCSYIGTSNYYCLLTAFNPISFLSYRWTGKLW